MWWSAPEASFDARAKVVVVGSGAGGAFVALTLAEAGVDVLLLEDGAPYLHDPLDQGECLAEHYMEGGFRVADGTPTLPVTGGRALGGSTIVNSALCFRTPDERIDEWNELSGDALDVAHWKQTQHAIEAVMRVAETPDALLSGNDRIQRDAARALGWKEGNLRRNAPACTGCGRCNQGCTVAGKNSVDREILPRAAAAGARITTGCRVQRVRTGRVEGVLRNGAPFSVSADAVVLCAGAIATPTLLHDSGVVDAEKGVGEGLRVQPVVSVLGYFPNRQVFAPGATQGHWIDEFVHDDIVIEANPTFASALAALPFHGAELAEVCASAHHIANTGLLVRDRTRGRVGPSSSGRASIAYDLVEEDRARFARALEIGARLWFEGAGAEWVVLSLFGRSRFTDMGQVRARLADLEAGRLVLYSSHPQASCGLGRVTDRDGQLLEVPGVYCMDASVLPSNVGRNPQISVMTMARVLSERLAVQLGGTPVPLVHLPPPADPG
ncbi:MAG: FAD-dependent oxidoreductase [Myxococcota bacterium]